MGFWNWMINVIRMAFYGKGANKNNLEEIVTESPVQSNANEKVNGGFDYSTPWDSAVYPNLLEVLLGPVKKNPELGIPEEERGVYSHKFFEDEDFLYARIYSFPYLMADEKFKMAGENGIFDTCEREENDGIKFYQKIKIGKSNEGEEVYAAIGYTLSTEPTMSHGAKASEEEKTYQRKLAGELVSYLGLKPAPKEEPRQERVEESGPQPVQEEPTKQIPVPAETQYEEPEKVEAVVAQGAPATGETLEEKAQAAPIEPQPQETPGAQPAPQTPKKPFYTPVVDYSKKVYGKTKEFGRNYKKVIATTALLVALGLAGNGIYQNYRSAESQTSPGGKTKISQISTKGTKTSPTSPQQYKDGQKQGTSVGQGQAGTVTEKPQTPGTQAKETDRTLEDKVQKDKVHEYKVKRGDSLWAISEGYGVKGIPSFINSVVDYQLSHSNNAAFKQRIAQDTIYVKGGKVRYAENVDGIRGDNLHVGDVIMVPQELVEKYKTGAGGETYTLRHKAKGGKAKHSKDYHKSERVHGDRGNYQSTHDYGNQVVGLAIAGDNRPILTFTRKIAGQKEKEFEKILGTELHQVQYIQGKTKFGSYPDSLYEASRRKQSK